VPLINLVVVMPVYNEADGLETYLKAWTETLDSLQIDYEIMALDDGSRDGSGDILERLASSPRIRAVCKQNEGHGPTILRGYADAVQRADWVFQADSDGEIPPSAFPAVWEARADHDAVLGVRSSRNQGPIRAVMSWMARGIVDILLGSTIRDVNIPFRLMRSGILADILPAIPAETFAPNVPISGVISRRGRVAEVPVPFLPRAGAGSIAGLRILRIALVSFWQTLRISAKLR